MKNKPITYLSITDYQKNRNTFCEFHRIYIKGNTKVPEFKKEKRLLKLSSLSTKFCPFYYLVNSSKKSLETTPTWLLCSAPFLNEINVGIDITENLLAS